MSIAWLPPHGLPLDHRGPVGLPFQPFGPAGLQRPMLASLHRQVLARPTAPACVDAGMSLDFAALWQAVGRLAQAIRAAAAPPGLVAVLAPNGVVPVVAAFACLAAGRPSLLLDPEQPLARLQAQLQAGGARLLLGPPLPGVELPAISADAAFQPTAVAFPPEAGWLGLDAPAFIHLTSGSTGQPRALAHSQRSLLARFASLADACHLSAADRLLGFSAGPGVWAWCTPLAGCALHLLPPAVGFRGLLAALNQAPATVLRAMPSLLRGLLRLPGAAAALGRLRLVYLYGEAVLRADVAALAAALPGVLLLNAYGATEAGGLHWFARPEDEHDASRVAAGLCWPGTEVALLDEAGQPVAPGEAGELVLRSTAAALGEWHEGAVRPGPLRPDPADPFRRIWCSGDLARQAPDGAVVVLGRIDRMVKLNGRRLEPAEVEAVLRAEPGVTDAAVLAEQAGGRTTLHGFVAAPGQEPLALRAALRQRLAAALPAAFQPARLLVLPALPLQGGSGKLDIAALRRLLEQPAAEG